MATISSLGSSKNFKIVLADDEFRSSAPSIIYTNLLPSTGFTENDSCYSNNCSFFIVPFDDSIIFNSG